MKFTKELLDKAKAAKSAEELVELAKAQGIEITAEEAEKAFAELHKSGELADDELDNVAGGGCDGNPSASGEVDSREAVVFLYETGQKIEWINGIGSQTSASIIVDRYVKELDSGRYAPWYKVKLKKTTNSFAGKVFDIAQSDIQIP